MIPPSSSTHVERNEATIARAPVRIGVPSCLRRELIGRSQLLGEIKQRLLRLEDVVLCAGLPGAGKTALAQMLAWDREVARHFDDYILWVTLGPKPAVIPYLSEWGQALGIDRLQLDRFEGNSEGLGQALTDVIGEQKILMIIDDAWESDPALVFKLGGPNCTWLVTTRFSKVANDFSDCPVVPVAELNLTDSMTLFTSLAPDVASLRPENIKRCLELIGGLPLAIILVARYLRANAVGSRQKLDQAIERVLNPHEVLNLRVPLPPSDWRAKEQTLHAAIKLSEDTLDESGRSALGALSVFPPKVNTFSRDAADHVSGVAGVIDELQHRGLVEIDVTDPARNRYTMHKAIADFASRTRAGDVTAFQRMAEFFTDYVARQAESDMRRSEWINSLDEEYENVTAALSWSVDSGNASTGMRLALALADFWEERAQFTEARRWITQLLTLPESQVDALTRERGLLLNVTGKFAYAQGDLNAAWDLHHKSRAVREKANLIADAAGSWNNEALILRERGRYKEAATLLRKAVQTNRHVGNRDWEARNLNNLGVLYGELGKVDQSERFQRKSLAIFSELEHDWGVAMARAGLSEALRQRGDLDAALKEGFESLEMRDTIGDRAGVAESLLSLARLAVGAGSDDHATAGYRAGAQVATDLGLSGRVVEALVGLGTMATRRGEFETAARYFGAARDYRERNSAVVHPAAERELAPCVERAREALGAASFDAAETSGGRAGLVDVAHEALGRKRVPVYDTVKELRTTLSRRAERGS